MKSWNIKKVGSLIIILLLIVIYTWTHQGIKRQEDKVQYLTPEKRQEISKTLAVLESGQDNPSQDLINRIDSTLLSLREKCPNEDEHQIAQSLNYAFTLLKTNDKPQSFVQIGSSVSTMIPGNSVGVVTCDYMVSYYARERIK